MASAEGHREEELGVPPHVAGSTSKDNDEDDGDIPTLSSEALSALKEFLAEQSRELAAAEDADEVALVAEDWRLSQFWYDRRTAETIAAEVVDLCANLDSPRVACIACPTLYAYLKKISPELPVQLLEYDHRFECYGSEFTFYDYHEPENLPVSLKHICPIVVADPPYLSKECLEKVAGTIKYLEISGDSRIILLTGEVQKDLAAELLGLRPCGFRPQHSSKLGNEFRVFTSYDPVDRLSGWEI